MMKRRGCRFLARHQVSDGGEGDLSPDIETVRRLKQGVTNMKF